MVRTCEPENGIHKYAIKKCVCGQVFCFECCKDTNVHEGGGSNMAPFMTCPKCGRDVLEN
jgi:hypothetical protein